MKYQISELAELAGVSTRTLRYYDNIGILKPTEIDESNGYRYYDENALEQLKRILYYRDMEFPLKEIPLLMTEKNNSNRLTKRRRELLEKRRRIEEQLAALDNELAKPVRLTKSFDRVMEMYNFSGCAHCMSGDEYFCSWGRADYENDTGFTPAAAFQIGGLTMQFTAYCVLKFCDKGLLRAEDCIDKYLPEFIHGREITIQHLLDMTSGLPVAAENEKYSSELEEYLSKNVSGQADEDEKTAAIYKFNMEFQRRRNADYLIDEFGSQPLKFRPGSEFSYNGNNYSLLGKILGKVSGKSLSEVFDEEIFKPLQLDSTSFGGSSNVTAYAGAVPVFGNLPADGFTGIVSTTEDLLKWCRFLGESGIFKNNEKEFFCGFFKKGNTYSFCSELCGMTAELSADFEKGDYSVIVRNRLPEPDGKKRVMYYPIHACDDGKIKFEVWQMKSGSSVSVTSVRIFNEKGETVYSEKAPDGEYIINVFNAGGVRHAADFSVDGRYFTELDLRKILGGEYSSEENYYAEVIADRGEPYDAQLGLVYMSGGEWKPMYFNVFYQREMSWALFMEALINSTEERFKNPLTKE